jgi:CrcB protein
MSDVLGWAGVGVFAALGALGRFSLDAVSRRRLRWPFPIGILVVNASGAFALGTLAGAGVRGWWLRLAGAALLGAYTTFSTWIFDSHQLAADDDRRGAILNVVGSLVLGLAAVALGWALGRAL